MAFKPGLAQALGWPGAARARFTREAAAALAVAAAGPEAALPALLQEARMALRRAVQLGQADGGAARAPALAALVLAGAAATGAAPSRRQLAAALAMHHGYAVELDAPGARPLAVALAAILAVWSGRGCHVVGASEYLSGRDAAALAPLYHLCGASVAALAAGGAAGALEQAYASDVVYASARQLLSDFLHDRMLLGGAISPARRAVRALAGDAEGARPVTRGTDVAIIDDLEAVLVDDAAHPVLISAAGDLPVLAQATLAAGALVAQLHDGPDYRIARAPFWLVEFSEQGEQRLAELGAQLPVFWRHPQRRRDLLSSALLARDMLERERHYVVQSGRVVVTDDNVYRMLAGRAWQFGMLQALEAREGLELSTPPRTVARAAVQTYFPRYARLAGVGASLDGCGGELEASYGLPSVSLAAAAGARPAKHYGYRDREAKLAGFIELLAKLHAQGVPLLACAPRAADLVAIGHALVAAGVQFQVADGRDPGADARLLAAAGQPGQVTLVAAGAGRNAEPDARAPAAGAPPHCLLFEHGDGRRADLAFFALAGQGSVFASLDDAAGRELPLWAAVLRPLARRAAPGGWAMRLMLVLGQRHGARLGARYRKGLGAREQQLDGQLAFSGQG